MAETADPGDGLAPIDADRGELLQVLIRHEVRFVVIGGAAIQSHGRRYVTEDIDLTPERPASSELHADRLPGGYADPAPSATAMPVAATSISDLIAPLDDVHAPKRAADRPEDRAYFEAAEGS